jgi:hypothetical protein
MSRLASCIPLLFPFLLSPSCGGAGPTSTSTGTAAKPGDPAAPIVTDDPAAPGGGSDSDHLCRRPIEKPAQVFDRIEAVRALGDEERARECGLTLVEHLSQWRVAPVDLLGPIVERAAADEEAFVAWVEARATTHPIAVANVVAMGVVRGWKIGGDPSVVTLRAEHWRGVLGGEVGGEISAVLDRAASLRPLLARVTEIHRLRCLLEINPLGFAVECVPIHPSGRPIILSWRTATRDGLLESLELTDCKSRSCKKLEKTASKLMEEYRAVLGEAEKLGVDVYLEQLKVWLQLPPFKSISA